MKVVKLKKTDLKKLPEELLRKFGLVNDKNKTANPSALYFSEADAKVLKQNLKNRYKKEMSHASSKHIEYSAGVHWLNLGPNESLKEALKPGYAIVDENTDV